ncbi:MAG: hypothetical protein ACOX1I_04295 [Dethiobacteria bacterium]
MLFTILLFVPASLLVKYLFYQVRSRDRRHGQRKLDQFSACHCIWIIHTKLYAHLPRKDLSKQSRRSNGKNWVISFPKMTLSFQN